MTSTTTRLDQPADAEHELAGQHGHDDRPFGERYADAVGDAQLSRNLTNFQQSWRASRGEVMGDVDFDALRARMKAAKTEAIDNLDVLPGAVRDRDPGGRYDGALRGGRRRGHRDRARDRAEA